MKVLDQFKKATQELADKFLQIYFEDCYDWHWVADEIGGVLNVEDYFFNLSDILVIMKYLPTFEQIDTYYNYSNDLYIDGKTPEVNLEFYLKTGQLELKKRPASKIPTLLEEALDIFG